MTVPLGEPCGCYDNRGCLDSAFCACECEPCRIQRGVDAYEICYMCRSGTVTECVMVDDEFGEDTCRFLCTDCAEFYHGDDASDGDYEEGAIIGGNNEYEDVVLPDNSEDLSLNEAVNRLLFF